MGEVWGLLGLAGISFARNVLIFFFGAKICGVKEVGTFLKKRILKLFAVAYLAYAPIRMWLMTLREIIWGSQAFLTSLSLLILVFGGLIFIAINYRVLSKSGLSPTKRNWFALGISLLSFPEFFLICLFLMVVLG
ncbi:MAG: hypothetical protein ACFNWZ_04010 [Candidatus Absconditicoccaceae bacterium]